MFSNVFPGTFAYCVRFDVFNCWYRGYHSAQRIRLTMNGCSSYTLTSLDIHRIKNYLKWKVEILTNVICRSQWARDLRRMCSAARLLRLWVRIPPGAWMSVVSVVCCQVVVSATS